MVGFKEIYVDPSMDKTVLAVDTQNGNARRISQVGGEACSCSAVPKVYQGRIVSMISINIVTGKRRIS